MAGNDERVNLLISAAVDGLKDVEGLISDLEELEKAGRVELPDNSAGLRGGLEETGEQMRGLAERLTDLREQQSLVTQFAELKKESQGLAEQQEAAKNRATELGRALASTEEPTRAQAQEFERARKAARDADQAWIDNQRSLNTLRGSLDEAGISTTSLADEQVRINKEFEGVNQQASEMSDELRQIKESADAASDGTDDAAESTKKLGEEADKSSGILGKLGGGIKVVAATAAGLVASVGASIATLTIFSRRQIDLAGDLTNTAEAIGINREALQVWQIAGERVGVTGDRVVKTLSGVTERLGRLAATGAGRAAQVMGALNMDIEEFQRLAPDRQLIKLAEAVEGLPKGEQVALLRTLGSDAEKLLPLLENNAAGLREIAEEAAQTGAIYTDEELDKLDRAGEVYDQISLKIQGITRRIGAELAPVVGDATRRVMELFDQSGSAEKLIDTFRRLIRWGEDLANGLLNNTDQISQGFQTVWNTVQAVSSGIVGVFRVVQTAVAGFLTLFAAGISNVLSATQGLTFVLNKLGLVSDEAYNNIRAKAEAARATTVDLANQTAEYGRKALEAGKDVLAAFEPAEQTLRDTEDQARRTGDSFLQMGEDADDAGDDLEDAAKKAAELEAAYESLGITTQQELEEAASKAEAAFRTIQSSGDATKREISDAFRAYAQAIIETGDRARMKALESEAATLGLRDTLEELAEAGRQAGASILGAFESALAAASDEKALRALERDLLTAASAGEDVSQQLFQVRQRLLEIQQLQQGGGVSEPVEQLGEETDNAGNSAEEAGKKFKSAFGDFFSGVMTKARESVSDLSVAARNLFETKIGGNQLVAEAQTARESFEQVNVKLGEMEQALQRARSASWTVTGSGLTRWALETAQAALEVEKAFYGQAMAMEDLQEKIESGSFSMDQLNRISETAANRFDLLDDQRLNGLQGAIDAARQRLESLTATADNTLNSLRQRLADIQGDTEEAQRLQYEAERKRLQEQLEQARQAGADQAAADYQQALDTLEKINAVEQRNRREQENAREKEAADRAREQQLAEIERQRAQRETAQTAQRTTQARTETVKTVNVNIGGQSVRVLAGDEENLIRALERSRSVAL